MDVSCSVCNLRLYKFLIWPHLEYACIVWDPHLQKDILKIERIQKFAFWVCLKKWRANYDSLLNVFTLPQCMEGLNFLNHVLCFAYLMGLCHLLLQYLWSPHPIFINVVIVYSCWSFTLILLLFNTHFCWNYWIME